MLVHLGLPGCEALATVEQIRKAAPETPIAVLSEVADEELAIEAVKAGSQDYLVKGEVDLSLIERSLRHAVERQPAQNALAVKRLELGDSETKLHKQSQILEWILSYVSDGVIVANKEGKFLLFNPAAVRMTEHGTADVTTDDWSEHYQLYLSDGSTPFPPNELPLVRTMRGKHFADEQVKVHHPDGNMTLLSVNGSSLTDFPGQLNGGIVVFCDLAESKAADHEISRLNSELEQRIEERTQELEAFVIPYHTTHDAHCDISTATV